MRLILIEVAAGRADPGYMRNAAHPFDRLVETRSENPGHVLLEKLLQNVSPHAIGQSCRMPIAWNAERHSGGGLVFERRVDNNGAPISKALEYGLGGKTCPLSDNNHLLLL